MEGVGRQALHPPSLKGLNMAWEYSGNPADSDKDAVRFLIGDTDTTEQLVQDEEIEWALLENADAYSAAAEVAQSLSAKFATLAQSTKIGPISENYSTRAANYEKIATRLEKKAGKKGAIGVVGASENSAGITVGIHDFTADSTDDE